MDLIKTFLDIVRLGNEIVSYFLKLFLEMSKDDEQDKNCLYTLP
jgi:hypothetical protein